MSAPQQPARARTAAMPSESSTRSAEGLMLPASAGCTQPASSSTRRACAARSARGAGGAGGAGARAGRRARQRARQQRAHGAGQGEQRAHAPRVRHDLAQQVAHEACARRAGHALLGEPAADVEQPPVLHSRRTGTLAGPAGQAAIQVQLRARADRLALEQLLHEIDAAARTVELVAQQLVGRAGGQAETAVHAAAQNGLRLAARPGCP